MVGILFAGSAAVILRGRYDAAAVYHLTVNYVSTAAAGARIGVPATVDVVVTRSTEKIVGVVATIDGVVVALTRPLE